MSRLVDVLREVVIANRILANEGVVDAFGHISVRHPDNPGHYLMSCPRGPKLVTMDGSIEFTLQGEIVGENDRKPYAERHTHGGIFERRGVIGEHVPGWDIADRFDSTNLLVTNMEQGRDLAEKMGDARVVLMRGHGCAVAASSIKAAVLTAIYTKVNAKLQLQAMPLGDVKYLGSEELELTPETLVGPLAMERAWEYFARRAMGDSF